MTTLRTKIYDDALVAVLRADPRGLLSTAELAAEMPWERRRTCFPCGRAHHRCQEWALLECHGLNEHTMAFPAYPAAVYQRLRALEAKGRIWRVRAGGQAVLWQYADTRPPTEIDLVFAEIIRHGVRSTP